MAHYAILDSSNVVVQVIVGPDEGENGIDWETHYGAKRTSYNTRGGVYFDINTNSPAEDQSKAFRKNYAGIGYTYDVDRDAFIPPKLFNGWILNEQTCLWEPPVPMPVDGNRYIWDDLNMSWQLFNP